MAEEVHPGSWLGDSVEEYKKLPTWGKIAAVGAFGVTVFLGYRAYVDGKSSTGATASTGGTSGTGGTLSGGQVASGQDTSGSSGFSSPFAQVPSGPTASSVPVLPAGLQPVLDGIGNLIGWQPSSSTSATPPTTPTTVTPVSTPVASGSPGTGTVAGLPTIPTPTVTPPGTTVTTPPPTPTVSSGVPQTSQYSSYQAYIDAFYKYYKIPVPSGLQGYNYGTTPSATATPTTGSTATSPANGSTFLGPTGVNHYQATGSQTLAQIASQFNLPSWNSIYAIPDNQKAFGALNSQQAAVYKPTAGQTITLPAGTVKK